MRRGVEKSVKSHHIFHTLTRCAGAQKPRLDDVAQLRRGALSSEHLDGVIPAHAPEGCTAADEDDLGLIF